MRLEMSLDSDLQNRRISTTDLLPCPDRQLTGQNPEIPPFRSGADQLTAAANIAVIRCSGLDRQKLPYVQALAGDGNWAGCGMVGFKRGDAIADIRLGDDRSRKRGGAWRSTRTREWCRGHRAATRATRRVAL